MQMEKTGAIKIGVSKNPEKRVKQLQTGCPYKIKIILKLKDRSDLEKRLHEILKGYKTTKTNKEWFDFDCMGELPIWIIEQLDLDDINTWWDT